MSTFIKKKQFFLQCMRLRPRKHACILLSLTVLLVAAVATLECAILSTGHIAGSIVRLFHPPGLLVATVNMWAGPADVLGELWVLSQISERAVGRPLVPTWAWLPRPVALSIADVVLIGVYGDRHVADAVARDSHAAPYITVFIASECVTGHDMAGRVDISFGQSKIPPSVPDGTHFLRLPWWLPYTLQRQDGCAVPHSLTRTASAAEWSSRPRFAALLSQRAPYPRQLLRDALLSLGPVDSPSGPFKTMDWPPNLPNSHLTGKLDFLRSYRWQITPENSRCDGYITEKLGHALLAGVVPIYWGDTLEPGFFNPRRIVEFNPNGEGGETVAIAHVKDVVQRLEGDENARAAWFAEPALLSTASSWIANWCDNATAVLRSALHRKGLAFRTRS